MTCNGNLEWELMSCSGDGLNSPGETETTGVSNVITRTRAWMSNEASERIANMKEVNKSDFIHNTDEVEQTEQLATGTETDFGCFQQLLSYLCCEYRSVDLKENQAIVAVENYSSHYCLSNPTFTPPSHDSSSEDHHTPRAAFPTMPDMTGLKDMELQDVKQDQASAVQGSTGGAQILQAKQSGEELNHSKDLNAKQQQEELQETSSTFENDSRLQDCTDHKAQEYFWKVFQSEEVAAEACRHTKESRSVYNLRANPSYCETVDTSLDFLFTYQCPPGERPPVTIAYLLMTFVFTMFTGRCRWGKDHIPILLKVCELAYEGICQETSVLEESSCHQRLTLSELRSHIPAEILEGEEFAGGVTYRFPHPPVQGFLAAVGLLVNADPEELISVLEKHYDERDAQFVVFLRCLFGLCSPALSQLLKELLGPVPGETICKLTAFLELRIQAGIQNMNSELDKVDLLKTLCNLYESQNEELARRTVGSTKQLAFGGWKPVKLTPINCMAIAVGIQLCHTVEDLNLNNCYIEDDGLRCLAPVLHRCKVLRLNENKLSDMSSEGLFAALTRTDCKIHTLELWGNHFTHVCAEHLESALRINQTLETLVLSHNSLGDLGARRLTVALIDPGCKIKILRLDCNSLTDDCAQDIDLSVSANWTMKGLDVDGNYFSDKSILPFTRLIKRNTGLKWIRLAGNKFSLFGRTQLRSLQLLREGFEVWV
ncbi:NACHT, LRR and PYD domains-containing protein 3-like [Rhincodon typus]|uniref:NACHT, LRR and PYD domains-containing protein 3-like n=1 Tax=Rhincodon typus TaxID=259920 RepID=UPI00202F0331|nr:NACHT, LRR and PYD domains-containing protein 3-like [Rhincodon typus]XP_048476762.1 NACHT, LRR and PYD domains-containing protein 3-like [Rhincodon typus]XP_048476763.1 NACHT, LRR and PYD domains-containing protein 3-like [Rhincodon typus]XP_048476764.1 NACHT, LRR and PYD domains-containing protein 3-like [Rhincodon typus]